MDMKRSKRSTSTTTRSNQRSARTVFTGKTRIPAGAEMGARSFFDAVAAATSDQDDDCLAEAEGKALINASGSSVPRRNFLPFLSVMRTVSNPETR